MNRNDVMTLLLKAQAAQPLEKPDKAQAKLNADLFEFAIGQGKLVELCNWALGADGDLERYSAWHLK